MTNQTDVGSCPTIQFYGADESTKDAVTRRSNNEDFFSHPSARKQESTTATTAAKTTSAWLMHIPLENVHALMRCDAMRWARNMKDAESECRLVFNRRRHAMGSCVWWTSSSTGVPSTLLSQK